MKKLFYLTVVGTLTACGGGGGGGWDTETPGVPVEPPTTITAKCGKYTSNKGYGLCKRGTY